MNKKKLCVILLTFNHSHLIKSTVLSILDQDYKDFDFIISDDCSTDGTWGILEELAITYDSIRIFRTTKNMGMSGNANYAFDKSNSEYIALLHHDDICRSDIFSKWLSLIECDDNISFVFNQYKVFNDDLILKGDINEGIIEGRYFLYNYLLKNWGCIVRGTALIRSKHWKEVGGMREEFGMLADIDLWMRFSSRYAVGYVPEPLIEIRQDRPLNYPKEYLETAFSWKRLKILFEIHASNRKTLIFKNSYLYYIHWVYFRFRVSGEVLKWLLYGILKRKRYIIATSAEGINIYEFAIIKLIRSFLLYLS